MSAAAQIDPTTGERIPLQTPPPTQIDPATGERIAPPPAPITAQNNPVRMQAAPPQTTKQILADFATDLQSGGGRTALGRFLGKMQGRTDDQGYTGLNAGQGPGVANLIGSPAIGITHVVQGAQQLPTHPLAGTAQMVQGQMEAVKIPSMIAGGPEVAAGIEGIPSAARAGEVLNNVSQAAHNIPVTLSSAADPLLRVQELGQTGSTMPKAARQLLSRATTPGDAPILFPEARDFYSNISRLSADEFNRLTPVMQRAVGALRAGMHSDLTAAAGAVGQAQPYAQAMAEYAQANAAGRALTRVGKYAMGTAAGAAVYNEGRKFLGVLSGK